MKFRLVSKYLIRFTLMTAIVLVATLALSVSRAGARPNTVITVQIATDGAAHDGYCSLVEAVANADFDADIYPGECAPGGGAEVIQFAGVTNITTNSLLVLQGDMTIDGGATGVTIHAAPNKRIFYVNPGGNIQLKNLILTDGSPSGDTPDMFWGGAIFVLNSTLALDNVVVKNNSACDGGGMYIQEGIVTVNRSTFRENAAIRGCSYQLYTYGGGGIAMRGGNLWVNQSTFIDNTAMFFLPQEQFAIRSSQGNAILAGQRNNAAVNSVTVLNTTIQQHGALWEDASVISVGNQPDGISLKSVTIDAGEQPWAIYSSANARVQNTLVTGKCLVGDNPASSHNLATDSSCQTAAGFTVKTPAQLNLHTPADNGGPTQTMALGTGSAAIDAGDDALCAEALFVNNLDQRDYVRPAGAHCDVGAFEDNAMPISAPTATPTATNTPINTPVPPTATPVPPTTTPTATAEPVCGGTPQAPLLLAPADNAKLKGKKVKLDWTDAVCALRYKIVVRDLTLKTDVMQRSNLTQSDVTVKNLTKGHIYRWRVQACNGNGCSTAVQFNFQVK